MSDLSLRAYHRKIDYWIEENEIDKAITQSEYFNPILSKICTIRAACRKHCFKAGF